MLVGVALTNAADLLRKPIDTEVTDLIGTLALRIFLAIALLSLDWSSLVAHLPMILSATVVQICASVLVWMRCLKPRMSMKVMSERRYMVIGQ